ncbi:10940_t:CDS:2, partial [Funneliformis geosporum]
GIGLVSLVVIIIYFFTKNKERKKVESIIVVKDMWSDDKNPLVTKEKAKKIDGRELDLTNFANLKEIKIDGNYLKSPLVKLELGEQPKLDFLYLPNNQLTHLDLTACPDLNLSRNNFPNTQDLSIFSYLINLTNLNLGGDNQEKINQGIYNRFTGSLEPLKNMNKLEWLSIGNTDLDSGLEYLPESIKYFNCSFEQREDAKCKIFAKILKNIERESFHQQLKFYKQKKIEKQISVQTDKEHIKIKPILNHLLEVAVKKLYLSLPNISQTDLKDIRKEIDILKNLRNRYIIQYYDTYSDDQELFIIMDYAENGTLTKLINNNESKEHD